MRRYWPTALYHHKQRVGDGPGTDYVDGVVQVGQEHRGDDRQVGEQGYEAEAAMRAAV